MKLSAVALAVAILAVADSAYLPANPKMGKNMERGWSWARPNEAWLLSAR